MSWLSRLFRRAQREQDLDRELAFHVDTRTEELMRDGHTREEARRLALAEFGGYTPIREVTRDASGGRWLTDLWQDLKYARRVLWSSKTFTVAAVASLAIGLGANAAVFRVMDSLMFRPLPVEKPGDLFYVFSESAGESRFSHPAYLRLAEAVADQAQLTASSSGMTVQVTINGVEQLVAAQLVAGNWFETLGVSPSAGRLLSPADDRMNGSEGVAVMSDRTWTRHFARNPSVIGSTLMVNGVPVTVVGIAEPGFDGVFVASPMGLWMPNAAQSFIHAHPNVGNDNGDDSAPWIPQDGISWLSVWGRQRPGASRDAITRRLEDRYAQVLATRYESVEDPERRARLTSDRITVLDGAHGLSGTRERLGPALTILLGMSALVLVVSCANLANLLLVRGVARQREFSLRLAIGAARGRLLRQLLAESVALAALGGLLGLVLATWGGQLLLRVVSSTSTPVLLTLPLDWRILGFGIAATMVTGVLFGLLPAIRLSKPAAGAAAHGARVIGASRGRFPVAKALVAAQVALSFVLVVAAALFMQSFSRLAALDSGYDRTAVVTARFDTRLARYEPEQLPELYRQLVESVLRIPGVESASLGAVGPATGSRRASSFSLDGTDRIGDQAMVTREDQISGAFIPTLGMRVVEGRDFDERDRAGSQRVLLVNQTFVRRFSADRDVLGRQFSYGGDDPSYTIVGVVGDVKADGQRETVEPTVYFALAQHPEEYVRNLYARVGVDPVSAIESIRRAINTVAPQLAVREVLPLGELSERTVATERMIARLAAVFGLLGTIVAIVGLYGAIAYSVARRNTEIGVRLALGASPASVRSLVIRETLVVVAAGLVVGVALALPAGRAAESMLFGLSPYDAWTMTAGAILIAAVGLFVGAIPAWRASRVNPVTALRQG